MSESEILEQSDHRSSEATEKLNKKYREWSQMLVALGVLNLILTFVGRSTAPMAVLFLLTAAATFFFRVTGMFLIIGVLFLWAAIGNTLTVVFGEESSFTIDILIFLIVAIVAFYEYRKLRPYEADLASAPAEGGDPKIRLALAGRIFPFGGCVISALSIGLYGFVWIGTGFLAGFDPDITSLEFEGVVYSFTMAVCVLAFSVSLAALLSGYNRRALSVAGMICAVTAFLCQLALFPMPQSGQHQLPHSSAEEVEGSQNGSA